MPYSKLRWFVVAFCATLFAAAGNGVFGQTRYLSGPDSQPQPGVPKGDIFSFKLTSQKYYPGATDTIIVYVPAQYVADKPACLCLGFDGPSFGGGFEVRDAFDNLIFKKQMPVTIGVWVTPASTPMPDPTKPQRYIRQYEYDATTSDFGDYVINEVLPALAQQKTKDGKAILISQDPNDHMSMGTSSGGIGAFTLAWKHPEFMHRVFSAIGSFAAMRGGDMYPALIRKTEPKPIRVFLQDGSADNPILASGDWFQQNQAMEESLRLAGYDVSHCWGVLNHEGSTAGSVFPEAMKWLWRDYPKPIVPGVSANGTLKDVLVAGESWRLFDQVSTTAVALASDPSGAISYADLAGIVYKLNENAKPSKVSAVDGSPTSMAFGKDGSLFVALPSAQKIVQIASDGRKSVAAKDIRADHVIVDGKGGLYVTEPGLHEELPSSVWRIVSGKRTLIDTGIRYASGVALSPDRSRLMIADKHTHFVYDGILQPDGTIQLRMPLFWLNVGDSTTDGDWTDATDLAMDVARNVYVATRMGVQICSSDGRMTGVLTLPGGKVSGLCFGGKSFDTLYVISAGKIYCRKMTHPTVPNFVDTTAK